MKICIHRGSKEIGGSCVELAYQGNRILLDYGLPLETEVAEINLIYPINWDSVLGVVISHPHQDHSFPFCIAITVAKILSIVVLFQGTGNFRRQFCMVCLWV